MKNANKRTKTLLGIAAVVLVIVVALVVLLPASGLPLFGTTTVVISPGNPSLTSGRTLGLTTNAKYNCNWFSSNDAAVLFEGGTTDVKDVTIRAQNVTGTSTATVEARCGVLHLNHVSTTVTVSPLEITPPIVLSPGLSASVGTGDTSCRWRATPDGLVSLSPIAGASITVSGLRSGTVTIGADCNYGFDTMIVIVR